MKLIGVFTTVFLSLAQAGEFHIKNWNFSAPSLTDKDSLFSPSAGDILFDNSDKRFWGYNGTAWSGLSGHSIITESTNFTADSTDEVLLVDATSNNITASLPAAPSNTGKIFKIKKIDSSTNIVTIDPNSSETIDGETTVTLTVRNEEVSLISDASNWQILSRFFGSEMIAFTPTGSWSTNTTYSGYYRKISADRIAVWIYLSTSGAPTSATLTVNIPNSSAWSIDTTKILDVNTATAVGDANILEFGVAQYNGTVRYSSTTAVIMSVWTANGTYVGPLKVLIKRYL